MDWTTAVKRVVLQTATVKRVAVPYCSYNDLLPSVLTRTPAASLRELLFLPPSRFETQLNQDVFALIANRFSPGFFVEIGANDGFTLSNTIYLEDVFGWSGIVVEANPEYRESLEGRRASSVIAAVTAEEGYHDFISAGLYGGLSESMDPVHESQWAGKPKVTVWGTTLERILDSGGAPSIINFISVDVEGGEVPIVEQLCALERYRFVCGCVEHNRREPDLSKISALLTDAGYRVVWPGQTEHDLFFIDGERWRGV